MPDLPLRTALPVSVPLAVCAWAFLPDPHARMLAIGWIGAVALAFAAAHAAAFRDAAVVMAAGVFLLRWLPLEDVLVWRELIILGGVLLVLVCLTIEENGALAIAAALAVAAVTPAITFRGVVFPYAVAAAVVVCRTAIPQLAAGAILLGVVPFVRYSFAPMLVVAAIAIALPLIRRVPVVPQTAAIALFALWPWSGLLARSFPAFLRTTHSSGHAHGVGAALEASKSVSVDVPPHVRTVILTASAANASRLRRGEVLGRIEASTRDGRAVVRDIRIGDVADFGFMRRDQFLHARNPLPKIPTDDIRGFGATAWLWGGGRVIVRANAEITALRITAASSLRRNVKLQVESIDFE